MTKFQPFLTADDLGIDLEEDSVDVTEDEVAQAIDTKSEPDFSAKAVEFARAHGAPSFDLRRKGGILFCRVSVADKRQLFRMEWLRRST